MTDTIAGLKLIAVFVCVAFAMSFIRIGWSLMLRREASYDMWKALRGDRTND